MTTVMQMGQARVREGRILSVLARESVAQAARKMLDHQVGSLVVVDDAGATVGILTERDIMNQVVAKSRNPQATGVSQVMRRQLICCTPGTTLSRAQRIMAQYGIRHLPIIERGVPVGMISSRDVMAHQLSAARAVARRQSRLLKDLESQYPGISRVRKDAGGRIIL